MPHNPPHRDQSSNNGKGDKGKKKGRGHEKKCCPIKLRGTTTYTYH
jgi:hypothetical protein